MNAVVSLTFRSATKTHRHGLVRDAALFRDRFSAPLFCGMTTTTRSLSTTRKRSNFPFSTNASLQQPTMEQMGITNLNVKVPPGLMASKSVSRRRKRQPLSKQRLPGPGAQYPVQAIHLGQTIDLSSITKEVFPSSEDNRTKSSKNSLVLELPPATPSTEDTKFPKPPRFIAVYRFGSVVCINIPPGEKEQYIDQIRKHVTDPVDRDSERKEDFGVMLDPSTLYYPSRNNLQRQRLHQKRQHLSEESHSSFPKVTGDYCLVDSFDLDAVAVISQIMAQTVALDTYNDTADDMLQKFAAINSAVRASGEFKGSDKTFLFKSVAHNNAIFIDMISKIRLKDRSETAWENSKYEEIHYGLKSEFEIDDRFDQIEYKLNLIQQNSKFFLEVLGSEKSNSLEWTIVWLIAVECILMCVDMELHSKFMSTARMIIDMFSGN